MIIVLPTHHECAVFDFHQPPPALLPISATTLFVILLHLVGPGSRRQGRLLLRHACLTLFVRELWEWVGGRGGTNRKEE